jgi:hypothetical protein
VISSSPRGRDSLTRRAASFLAQRAREIDARRFKREPQAHE